MLRSPIDVSKNFRQICLQNHHKTSPHSSKKRRRWHTHTLGPKVSEYSGTIVSERRRWHTLTLGPKVSDYSGTIVSERRRWRTHTFGPILNIVIQIFAHQSLQSFTKSENPIIKFCTTGTVWIAIFAIISCKSLPYPQ